MSTERIERELTRLRQGGQRADLVQGERLVVLYRDVPRGGSKLGLAPTIDVVVPVPPGYPAAMIDLAGLPQGSPLLARLKGGQNNQGVIAAEGRSWQLASYHPHNGGGGPAWNPSRHGFDTYLDYVIAWLHCIN